MNTPELEYRRVVRHQTGHTLGFPHEHMCRALVARIDHASAYDYFFRIFGWGKQTVDAQVLTPLDERSLMGTASDQTSVMSYQLPGSITRDNSPILGGLDINQTDYAYASKIYPKEPDKCEYLVWYGTNRRPRDSTDIKKGYSAKRDKQVHYGTCRVYIPESHKIGSLGSPWWKRLRDWTDDRIKLLEIGTLNEIGFWQQVSSHLTGIGVKERHAVIFVHGYNVSFEDAALRAAQIGFDLSIRGAMAFFSWPSQARLDGYAADEATIETSEHSIANFMVDFATSSRAKAVHIIAHSMGNRGVLRAVNRIADRAQRRTGVPFSQIILAAADVDTDTFREFSTAYRQVARRTTLYVSTRDRAVEASRWLHKFERAGLMPPICVVPRIDTINVTNVDLTMFGHGYIGDARDVLQDIHQLIFHNAPPNKRFGLREGTSEEGKRFWIIGV